MDLALTWAAALAVIWLPGLVVERVLRPRPAYEPIAKFSTQLALGLSLWPIALLWTDVFHLRWTPAAIRLALAFCVAAAVVLTVRERPRLWRWRRPRAQTIAMLVIVGLTVISRLLHVQGVGLPLWVDSVHHTMITRLLVEHGDLPASYEPFLPNSSFYYHWGFHAIAAAVAMALDQTSGFDIAAMILHLGQFLNALTPLFVYTAARALFGTRRAGVLAAAFAALVSFFPAYYVSWGRYTHLAGVLLLPMIGVSLRRNCSRKFWWGNLAELIILSAGLALIHVRVAFFAVTFAAVFGIARLVAGERRFLWRWGVAAVCAGVLAVPWFGALARNENVRKLLRPPAAEQEKWATVNWIDPGLLWAPNNVRLAVLATGGLAGLSRLQMSGGLRFAGVCWWLALVIMLETRRRRRRPKGRVGGRMAMLAGWIVLTAAIINLDRLGFHRLSVVPNSAAIITLFLPLSLAAAGLCDWVVSTIARPRKRNGIVAVAAVAAAWLGFESMRTIVNPITVLAQPGDVEAMRWIARQTPAHSRFMVSARPWIGGSFVGADGGYWIPLLTDRRSVLPPGLYTWVAPPAFVQESNRMLANWFAAVDPDDELLRGLERAGVTHIYFGVANRSPMREQLRPLLTLVYDRGGVTIFALRAIPRATANTVCNSPVIPSRTDGEESPRSIHCSI